MLDGIAVGYNTDVLVGGRYRMFGPSFNAIGNATGMKIKDMSWGAVESGDALILIDKVTCKQTQLTYIIAEDAEGLEDGAGWYDTDADPFVYYGNENIDRGFGFWMFPGMGNAELTFSGEVKGTYERSFVGGAYGAFTNPFPVKMALKKFGWSATESGDALILVDKATAKQTQLTYIIAEDAEGLEDGAGWYDTDADPFIYYGNEELDPGQGCWIFPGMGDATLTGSLDL